jgi:hypothetical protein
MVRRVHRNASWIAGVVGLVCGLVAWATVQYAGSHLQAPLRSLALWSLLALVASRYVADAFVRSNLRIVLAIIPAVVALRSGVNHRGGDVRTDRSCVAPSASPVAAIDRANRRTHGT